MNRRTFLQLLSSGAAAGMSWPMPTIASGYSPYPAKELRLVVPFPAGGAADNLGRPLAQELSAKLGQPVVVENRPGANSMIGARFVAESPPDGYTLFLGNEAGLSIASAVAPITKVTVPYDPEDFAPISVLGQYGSVLSVSPKLPVRTLAEFIDYSKRNPKAINYASFGVGSQPQMMMEMLAKKAGIEVTHVPYKGVAPAVVDLIAGHVQAMISAPSAPMPYIRDAKLRALAYSGEKRLPNLPDVPTFAEAGMPDFEARGWFGVLVRTDTPDQIKAELRERIWSIVQSADYQSVAIFPSGYEVPTVDPSQFPEFLTRDMAQWKSMVAEVRNRLI